MMRVVILIALLATSCNRTIPEIALANMDPVVAQQISNAVAEVRHAPDSGAAWGRLGLILKAAGMDSKAQESFVRAEKLEPTNPRWPYFQDNVDSLQRAAVLTNADFVRLRLAELLAEAGRWDEAEDHFGGHSLGRAQIACAQGRWQEALAHLER